jgi:hypothetical protein
MTYGPKTEDITAEWKQTYNEEFHYLYSSPSIIILKPKDGRMDIIFGNTPIGRSMGILKDIIERDVKETV